MPIAPVSPCQSRPRAKMRGSEGPEDTGLPTPPSRMASRLVPTRFGSEVIIDLVKTTIICRAVAVRLWSKRHLGGLAGAERDARRRDRLSSALVTSPIAQAVADPSQDGANTPQVPAKHPAAGTPTTRRTGRPPRFAIDFHIANESKFYISYSRTRC